MKIPHDDVARIPAPDAAVLVDSGFVKEWPFEMRGVIASYWRKHGYYKMIAKARAAATGELTERTPT